MNNRIAGHLQEICVLITYLLVISGVFFSAPSNFKHSLFFFFHFFSVGNEQELSLNVTVVYHDAVLLKWAKDMTDTENLLAYIINYREL